MLPETSSGPFSLDENRQKPNSTEPGTGTLQNQSQVNVKWMQAALGQEGNLLAEVPMDRTSRPSSGHPRPSAAPRVCAITHGSPMVRGSQGALGPATGSSGLRPTRTPICSSFSVVPSGHLLFSNLGGAHEVGDNPTPLEPSISVGRCDQGPQRVALCGESNLLPFEIGPLGLKCPDPLLEVGEVPPGVSGVAFAPSAREDRV